jgi:thiosulfate/3-mercaptopyruvate sulfurtransferase
MQLQSPLVSTEWLAKNLGEPSLRIYDATLYVKYLGDSGDSFGGYTLDSETAFAEWSQAHIPDSNFIDLKNGVFDLESAIPFTMPSADAFVQDMSRRGVSDDTTVVLYSKGSQMWATRVWWMLRSIGFDNAAVLDGGWEKWQREGRPTDSTASEYPKGMLSANPRPHMWIAKPEVLDVVRNGGPTMINALPHEVYTGEINRYGRPGHLPGSFNVPYASLIKPETNEFRKPEELRPLFAQSGALDSDDVIVYCGGGISATMVCLALGLCGQHHVAVYDGSMNEWVLDETLPLKLGATP